MMGESSDLFRNQIHTPRLDYTITTCYSLYNIYPERWSTIMEDDSI